MESRRVVAAGSWLLAFLVTACAAHHPAAVDPSRLPPALTFLQEGSTSHADVISRLGRPSARFLDDRILTYRLDKDLAILRASLSTRAPLEPMKEQRYSLVLAFDPTGILRRHRLIQVR